MNEQEFLDKLDQYIKGNLSREEANALLAMIDDDPALRRKAEEHKGFIKVLEFYNQRKKLKSVLEDTHGEIERDRIGEKKTIHISAFKKYWPMVAVAASVALFSILGTLYLTQSLATKQTAYYKELRRNVDQIKKSQSQMMADIAETKEKVESTPARYAGTGFLISANGYLATSYHVVKDADSVYFENETFGQLKASVLFHDAKNDISILKIDSANFKPLKNLPFSITKGEANLGESVYTLGFPREDIVFGEGSISAASGYRQNPNAYQVSVPVNPGNSGGPLFNEKGDLVGIISGVQTETSGAGFATKSTILLDAINQIPKDSLGAPLSLSPQNKLKSLSKVDRIRRWKEFVFMVRVYNN